MQTAQVRKPVKALKPYSALLFKPQSNYPSWSLFSVFRVDEDAF